MTTATNSPAIAPAPVAPTPNPEKQAFCDGMVTLIGGLVTRLGDNYEAAKQHLTEAKTWFEQNRDL